MHVRWRRETALGRSRRRARLAAWPDFGVGGDAGCRGWESVALAERYAAACLSASAPGAERDERPVLCLLSGLPGSGKSRLARELAARASLVVVSSDRVRRLLFASPDYSDVEHAFVHEVCFRLSERGLAAGRTVVLDATNLRNRTRERYQQLAWRHEVPFHLVAVETADIVVRERLRLRAIGAVQDGSDADGSVYDLLRQTVEPIRLPHLRVRGDGDVRIAAERVVALLRPKGEVLAPLPVRSPVVMAASAG